MQSPEIDSVSSDKDNVIYAVLDKPKEGVIILKIL